MKRDNSWFRRTTWAPADRAAFEQRNQRSRGANSKAQHIRIQAETLLKTGEPSLVAAALEMLERSFVDYSDAMDAALAYECAGQCCEQLSRPEDAAHHYLAALTRQRQFPGIVSNACFRLGKVAVEAGRADLYDTVLAALQEFGRLAFPWHVYMANGIRAVIAADRGDERLARELAGTALEAAGVRDAGWGTDGIGVVKDDATPLRRRLRELAGA